MHDDEITSSPALVARLIAAQVPALSGLPVTQIGTTGTDNAMYRVGEDDAARLPRRVSACRLLQKEALILPRLAYLPLRVPMLRHLGQLSDAFAYPFTVVDWIPGTPAAISGLHDPVADALRLAHFLFCLRLCPTDGAALAGAANHKRGVALGELDPQTRDCIDALADEIDADAARAIWDRALQVPPHQGPPQWLHGDLKADNLLAHDGKLVAVIDWGLAAVGDPAVDLACAWAWMGAEAEAAFRDTTDLPDADWERARGWALYGAVIALAYYRALPNRPCRNEALCAISRQTLSRLGLR